MSVAQYPEDTEKLSIDACCDNKSGMAYMEAAQAYFLDSFCGTMVEIYDSSTFRRRWKNAGCSDEMIDNALRAYHYFKEALEKVNKIRGQNRLDALTLCEYLELFHKYVQAGAKPEYALIRIAFYNKKKADIRDFARTVDYDMPE